MVGPLLGGRRRHELAAHPRYQDYWNGRGFDGQNHGTYIPDVWRGGFPGHRFFWGLNWDSAPDPMHFQYVTNY